jgi:Arc/MetJ family transcription regulator
MSKRPDNAEVEPADRRYCARLVEVAFPSRVWIGGTACGREELRAALSSDEDFKQRAAKRLGTDPDSATNEELVEKAFPAAIEFEGKRYDRDQLLEALLASPAMRVRLAEKYHYASDELYFERLVEIAFKRGKNHESFTNLPEAIQARGCAAPGTPGEK